MINSVRSAVALAAIALSLGGCDLFDRYFGAPPKPPLPGDRISVLADETKVEADPKLADVVVEVPVAVENEEWLQPGGSPNHVMQHLLVSGIGIVWRTSLGSGVSRDGRVTSTPVVADGRVYAMDAESQLSAVNAATGGRIWTIDVEASGSRSSGGGGGVAINGNTLFVATGQAQILAVEAATGKELWRTTLTAPFRSGPAVAGGRVFAISVDNQIHALDAQSGRKLWAQAGITEAAGLFGTSSPAIEGNIVVASFSSGEIFAIRSDNGRVLWTEALGATVRTDAISALSDVRGLPVIEKGVVYAISHGGRFIAIDLRSGARIWEQNVGSLHTPWLAGDFLFVTTVDNEVVAVRRRDGRVRWARQLESFTDVARKRGRIVWTGPTMVGNRLIVFSSEGQAVTIAPTSGAIMERLGLPGSVSLPPAIAKQTMYVVTDDGDLVALR